MDHIAIGLIFYYSAHVNILVSSLKSKTLIREKEKASPRLVPTKAFRNKSVSLSPASVEIIKKKMDFSSPSPPMGSSKSPEAIMEQIQASLAQEYAKEFIETLRVKCFEKCITKPGSSLSSGESSCISRCVDRYMEAQGIISRSLFSQQR
ncbi:unnamed protein product [Eruca vesicaria subsp. sativa]|uniref:Mitochondrial import inner membrane translocase subunit n=1 Tax=Eruca vesicaria subsp. sativa TaxID=29727 RepID=A0ABC8KFZ6_ERUVS|nr:unnamed protein product [Eruca vesicaria subsp. sativa]